MIQAPKEVYLNNALMAFVQLFYKQSDCSPPKETDPYIDFFTSSSILIMGSNKVQGHEEIGILRKNMWQKVTKRKHTVKNIAPISEASFLLSGYVEYTLINGKTLKTDWAAHMVFENTEFQKMGFYQVYLDSSQMINALGN